MVDSLRLLAGLPRRFVEFNREVDRGMSVMRGRAEAGAERGRGSERVGVASGRTAGPRSEGGVR